MKYRVSCVRFLPVVLLLMAILPLCSGCSNIHAWWGVP